MLLTTGASRPYYAVAYRPDDILLLGYSLPLGGADDVTLAQKVALRDVNSHSIVNATTRFSFAPSGSLRLGEVALGLSTALLLNRDLRGFRIASVLILLPWFLPNVVALVVFERLEGLLSRSEPGVDPEMNGRVRLHDSEQGQVSAQSPCQEP